MDPRFVETVMTVEPPKQDQESDDERAGRASVAGETESAVPRPTETKTSQDKVAATGIPKRIGQYRIKRAMASGGMGTVYEALQEKPRRTVASSI